MAQHAPVLLEVDRDHRLVGAARVDEVLALDVDDDGAHRALVLDKLRHRLARRRVPHSQRAVGAAREDVQVGDGERGDAAAVRRRHLPELAPLQVVDHHLAVRPPRDEPPRVGAAAGDEAVLDDDEDVGVRALLDVRRRLEDALVVRELPHPQHAVRRAGDVALVVAGGGEAADRVDV